MKKIYSLFLMLLCCMAAGAQDMGSVDEFCYRFVSRLLGDDNGDYDYYIGLPAMQQVNKSMCLVFVDEEPGSGWEHPCKYVYLTRVQGNAEIKHSIVDSVCPPTNITLRPIHKPNRYGANATKKPAVEKDLSNAPNEAAGNTYAVILNGGMSTVSNKEHYWNDCSFFYQTLRNRYDIPKSNIKVIMSDGTDEGDDLNLISGGYASSPLDLDGDGQPDIEYAATKENLQLVFGELAQKLTDNDHLLLFVTDHGGIDKTRNNKTYMYLWNNVKLYPEELAAYLEPIDAGFVSIVMGQCYSGGFIEALKKTNRIIATASSATEMSFRSTTVPFNEFLYHWTSALNGYDAFGNEVDGGEALPIADAQLYAAKHDFYANNGTKRVKETPQISYFTNSVASDLSLSCIPPTVDIVFDKYKEPQTSELVTKAYEKKLEPADIKHPYDSDLYNAIRIPGTYVFWNNPYIWLRNNRDGEEHQKSEKLIIEEYDPVFAYFKVRNRGVKDYKGSDQKVRGFWSKANAAINIDGWIGGVDSINHNYEYAGGSMGSMTIPMVPAGENHIGKLSYTFAEDSYTIASEPDFNMCVLMYIRGKNDSGEIPTDEDRIVEVWKTNKLGQSNLDIVSFPYDSMRVCLSNLSLEKREFDIVLLDSVGNIPLFRNARLSMNLSPDLSEAWNRGGQNGDYVEFDKNKENAVLLKSNVSKLKGLKMEPYQSGRIGLACNFFANEAITERKQYDVDVALVNSVTGKCVGGESFRIIQEPRPAITPLVNATVQDNGKTMLEATNVDEEVVYKWYDATGSVVGTGATFEVPAGAASNYTVRAEAVSDGAISDSAPVTAETSTIKAVDAQSSIDAVDVRFYEAVPGGTKLCLTSSDGRTPATYYNVENGASGYAIPATDLSSGIYQVTMIQNGTVTGVKKFVK